MDQYAVVGKRLPRLDATTKVTGQARYIGDIKMHGMLCGRVVRSPYPHARILRIDTSRAQQLKGVKVVMTADDTPKIKVGWAGEAFLADKMPLQDKKVRFVGDEVVAVAAVDEDTAEEAIQLIRVDYEELPAVFDPVEAMKAGAPLVHEETERNIGLHRPMSFGDVERGFNESDYIFEDTFRTQPQALCCMEVHGAIAHWDASGRVTVWATSQNLRLERLTVAQALGISTGKVRIINSTIGGGFGSKVPPGPAALAALLAKRAGSPVSLINDRQEEFAYSGHRHPVIHTLKTGVRKDGRLIARQITTIVNSGAYHRAGILTTMAAGFKPGQLYGIPNLKFDGYLVYTNNTPGTGFRGVGGVQIHFAMESQMDIIAERLGIDPKELRLINANRPNTVTASGAKITTCGLIDCIERSAAALGWQQKRSRPGSKGVGMAALVHGGGGAKLPPHDTNLAEAIVKVDEQGMVNLLVGEPDLGTGSDSILAMMVAEDLGVELEDITVSEGDTDAIPLDSQGTFGSRVTFVAGNAVKLAAADAKRQILEGAADRLEADPDDLEARNRLIYVKGSPERSISIVDAIAAAYLKNGRPITGRGQWTDTYSSAFDASGLGSYTPTYHWANQAVEVEIDRETGQVNVLKVASAHDLGYAINPMFAEGQIEGALAMGLGFALTEDLKWDGGRVLNPNFADYKMLGVSDIPLIEPIMVETVDAYGPFGAKGLGEPGMVATAPAIANAVYDAVGVRIKDVPITPEKVLKALKEKKERV